MSRTHAPAFTTVELLITLFVAAAFLIAGYQLFSVVIADGGNARAESRAGNVAYSYLRQYGESATNPCTTQTPLSNSNLSITGLDSPLVTVTITCPQTDAPTVSRVEAVISYGTPQQTVKFATFVDKSKGATPSVDVTSGLIARWPMNGNANADVGSVNGTISGGVTPTANRDGTVNQALAFDGVNGYINIPYSSAIAFGSAFTVSAWINPNVLSSRYGIFSTRTVNTTGSFQFEVGTGSGGSNRISVTGQGIWLFDSVNNTISTGTWQLVTYVMPSAGSSAGVVYVNAAPASANSSNSTYALANNTDPRRIGQGTSGGQPFSGGIDDVRIYNRALSASEVLQLYNTGPR